jgi:hypothetical protein
MKPGETKLHMARSPTMRTIYVDEEGPYKLLWIIVTPLEWQLAIAEEIATLDNTSTWGLMSPPHVCPITCKWVNKRIRLALMVLLSVTKLVL